jgi:deferrochelatase/peroxidase EfeB
VAPSAQFVPIQNRMAQQDALTEYLKFTSSAIFAVPAGAGPGEYVGQSLFA